MPTDWTAYKKRQIFETPAVDRWEEIDNLNTRPFTRSSWILKEKKMPSKQNSRTDSFEVILLQMCSEELKPVLIKLFHKLWRAY